MHVTDAYQPYSPKKCCQTTANPSCRFHSVMAVTTSKFKFGRESVGATPLFVHWIPQTMHQYCGPKRQSRPLQDCQFKSYEVHLALAFDSSGGAVYGHNSINCRTHIPSINLVGIRHIIPFASVLSQSPPFGPNCSSPSLYSRTRIQYPLH